MRKAVIVPIMGLLLVSPVILAAAVPDSIRGKVPVQEATPAEPMATYPNKYQPLPRELPNQPPLVPHKYSYEETEQRNLCIGCHDPAKDSKAKPTHVSHYSWDGRLKGDYYFCNHCHVPQADNQ